MATSVQPPRPPMPPAPPRARSNVLAIVLLSLALIVIVSLIGIAIGLRIISHAVYDSVRVQVNKGGRGQKVSITTPVGSLEVNKNVDEASLGLPIYPGAKRLRDEDGATVNMNFGGKDAVRVAAAKFQTPDSLEKVRDFYKQQLGSEVTKFTEKDGKTVFEIKRHGLEKVVALKSEWAGTRIEIVRVDEGRGEGN